LRIETFQLIQQPDEDESVLAAALPVAPEAEEFAHGVVVPGAVVPNVLGSGTVSIGLRPLVPVSVAPSGIVLPITLEFEVEDEAGVVPLPDVVVQLELGDGIPPPSKVGDVDDVVPLAELAALQVELGARPRPPGSISVAPSGTPAPLEPPVTLVPIVPRGEVAPNPDGLMAVWALLAAQVQKIARAAIEKCRTNISCIAHSAAPGWPRLVSEERAAARQIYLLRGADLSVSCKRIGCAQDLLLFQYNAHQSCAIVRGEAQATPSHEAW
jgi:hypothetical protein